VRLSNQEPQLPKQGLDPVEFDEILLENPPPLLVGGQAVNLWAKAMLHQVPALEQFQPFLSKDCDVYGNVEFLMRHANTKPWQVTLSKKGQASPTVGFLQAERADGKRLLVEVLYAVKGLTPEDLSKVSRVEFDGKSYSVLNPVTLLKAKLANYTELPQNTPGQERDDLKHIKILVPCIANFIQQAHARVQTSAQERGLVNLLEETLEVVCGEKAKRTSSEQGIDFLATFPPVLAGSNHPRIQNFVTNRLLPLKGREIK